jgi:hypothetical protein
MFYLGSEDRGAQERVTLLFVQMNPIIDDGLFAHSQFDFKIIHFLIFFIQVISLAEYKMFPIPCKSNGKERSV